jgi:inorganic pyrophosphatase
VSDWAQDGTTDWKVIVIDINDPLAALVNSKPTLLIHTKSALY